MDTSCEILLVADRDPQLATDAVELITAGRHGTISEGPNGKIVPWIITNKYYTAAVSFLVPPPVGQQDSASKPITDDAHTPALIYVFKKGDAAARATFLQSLPAWKAHAAEVNLALAFESGDQFAAASSTEPHDAEDAESDDFFAENGFEYVLARTNAPSPDDQVSVLGIPRVLDALSSIRWPSLVRNDPAKAIQIDPKFLPSSVEIVESPVAKGPTSLNVSTENLTDAAVLSLFASRICGGAIDEKHVGAIEEWLEETPTSDSHNDLHDDFEDPPQDLKTPRAFTDNFTGFFDPTPRGPLRDVSPYTTPVLKSSGLFVAEEEPTKGKYSVDNDPSAWYPTKEEIKSATHRIFGGSANSSSADLRDIGFDGSDDEAAQFDLSRVFSQLQVMKEEVSHIKDPKEKRKAAAKAAHGFVEGLGLGSEPSTDAESDDDIDELLEIQ